MTNHTGYKIPAQMLFGARQMEIGILVPLVSLVILFPLMSCPVHWKPQPGAIGMAQPILTLMILFWCNEIGGMWNKYHTLPNNVV